MHQILDKPDRIPGMNLSRVAKIVDAKGANIRELATLMTTGAKA